MNALLKRRYAEAIPDRIVEALRFCQERKVWLTLYELQKMTGLSVKNLRGGLYRRKVLEAGLRVRPCRPTRRGCLMEYKLKPVDAGKPKA